MKQTLKAIFILINLLFTFSVASNGTDKVVDEYVKNKEKYKAEARKLTSFKIYENISLFSKLIPRNHSYGETFLNENTQKASVYLTVLQERYKDNNEPEAAYYYANIYARSCFGFKQLKNENSDVVKQCFYGVIDGYKFASKHGIAGASYNIGVIYREGLGVNKSKIVASKWFVVAAEQYRNQGLEDNFLDSLEQALKLMPDNPRANMLKKAYLNK